MYTLVSSAHAARSMGWPYTSRLTVPDSFVLLQCAFAPHLWTEHPPRAGAPCAGAPCGAGSHKDTRQ